VARRVTRRRYAGSRTRPMWLRLGVLVLAAVLMGLGMVLSHATTPRLGLDLQGGTSVTLTPVLTGSGASTKRPDSGAIDKAVDIIRQRVNGLGVSEADVRRANDNIEIAVPGKGRDEVVDLVGQTAQLRFREVAASAAAAAPPPAPTGTPTPKVSATPAPKQTPSASPTPKIAPAPSASARPRVLSQALAAATPAPVTPSPAASSSTPKPAPMPPAAGTPAPSAAATSAGTPPTAVVAQYATLQCTATDARKGKVSTDQPGDWVTACSKAGDAKYLLKPAKVVGSDVAGATATLQQLSQGQTSNNWVVEVSFTKGGQAKFTNLTAATTGKQVAIVLDGVVQSAPNINERIAGSAEISGSFDQKSATDLANILRYGALPIAFRQQQVDSISATLGQDSLHAGLIAGGIGLALVVLYSLLYYRALGLVTIASLLVSGALVYECICLLGAGIGFTLSLAGIAGFIVAVGITADSFVVFFERLKDEVREGRTVRSGVERGWVRARNTILSADFVSFLAAATLYFLSIGSVRGFAFTLGLSTLLDVAVVFLFTKPVVTLLVRRNLFSTSRISGLTVRGSAGGAGGSGGSGGSGDAGSAAPARMRLTKRAPEAVTTGGKD